jgi:chaperonin GroEL
MLLQSLACWLTTECVVADKPKKEEPHAHGGAPGMGGMDY